MWKWLLLDWDGAIRRGSGWFPSAVLFLARGGIAGLMCFLHGYPKLMAFQDMQGTFPDPFQIGAQWSLTLVVGSEFLCAALIVMGLLTRLALIPLLITMATAAFWIHAADALAKKELAILYLCAFLLLWIAGPGRFSIDHRLSR